MADGRQNGNSAVSGADRRPDTLSFSGQAVFEMDGVKYIVKMSDELPLKIYGAIARDEREARFNAVASAIARAIHLKKGFTILVIYYAEDWYWGIGHHYDSENGTAVVIYSDTVTYYYNYRAVDRVAEIYKKPEGWVVMDPYKKKIYAVVEVVQ